MDQSLPALFLFLPGQAPHQQFIRPWMHFGVSHRFLSSSYIGQRHNNSINGIVSHFRIRAIGNHHLIIFDRSFKMYIPILRVRTAVMDCKKHFCICKPDQILEISRVFGNCGPGNFIPLCGISRTPRFLPQPAQLFLPAITSVFHSQKFIGAYLKQACKRYNQRQIRRCRPRFPYLKILVMYECLRLLA